MDPGAAIWKNLTNRPVYIWGAGNQGRGLCKTLEQRGLRPEGFIDRSTELSSTTLGYPVLLPDAGLAEFRESPRPFIVIASFFFEEEIADSCRAAGLEAGEDFVSYTSIKPFDYAVDISGVCNLKCISCPRADRSRQNVKEGFMSLDTFQKVLDKILREDPLAGCIQLYQWGEPLLNPRIGEIIQYANGRGVQVAVSSNLNSDKNLKETVCARPGWFRISVSGWGKRYEKTHTGGSWRKFQANFQKLAQLRRESNPDMKTEVYYHLYRDNQGDEVGRVKSMCEEAGFEFHPVYAYLISLDDVLVHLEGGDLPTPAREASELLAVGLEEGMALAREERGKDCLTLRCVHVNWDLSVSNCMMFYDSEGNRAARDFLETPLAEIVKRRNSCELCRRCRKQALHRYCSVYSTMTPQLPGGR